jgi:hypothetical protein
LKEEAEKEQADLRLKELREAEISRQK